MHTTVQDLRYAGRALSKTPGFAFVAVLTLALGIGANTTIFSWINSTLLNPIPAVTHTSGLVSLMVGTDPTDPNNFSYPDYLDIRDRNNSFSGLAATDIHSVDLTGSGKPERIWGTLVSTNYFDVLQLKPFLGRMFVPADEEKGAGTAFAVISYRLWQTHYGADPNIVGRTIGLNTHPYTIVGVAPPLFQGSQTGLRADLWVPLAMQQQIVSPYDRLHDRSAQWLVLLGRLKPGVGIERARQDVTAIMQRLIADYPSQHLGRREVSLFPLWRAPFGANAYLYVLLPMLMAIAGLVLLLACANVANLMLVRSVARQREIAIRLALGASRARLIRQMLTESALLALTGAVIALGLTLWTARLFGGFIAPSELPISLQVPVDARVLLASLIVASATALLFGMLPALRASGVAPWTAMRQESGGTGAMHKARLSSGIAAAQVAISVLLLVSAGLFIRGFRNAQKVDVGFNPEGVVLESIDLFPAGYKHEDGLAFQRQLLLKLRTLPGVQSVSLADWVPLGFANNMTVFQPDGYRPQPHESMAVSDADVGPDYFATMQIPLVAGRQFTFDDGPKTQHVAMVNQALAARYWPGENAIGKHLRAEGEEWVVVGIARNSQTSELADTPPPLLYLPIRQDTRMSSRCMRESAASPWRSRRRSRKPFTN
jgi:predicted permease